MALKSGMVLSTGEKVVEVRHGGFAEVGVLEDEFEGRKVIKRLKEEVLREGGEDVAEAFFRECRIVVSKLREKAPYIAEGLLALRNLDDLGPVLFVSYVDGPALRRLIRDRRQSLSQALRLGDQIAEGIAFAHGRDVRHRDLKPSNVLLTRTNEIRLIDWGLSRAHDVIGLTARVPEYQSPQRRVDPALDDPADDVYAVGVILYECLTGGYPPEAADPPRLRAALVRAHPLAPAPVLQLLCRMLAFHPEERPSAAEVKKMLSDPALRADVAAREIENPFCRACSFVAEAATRTPDCPVCGEPMYERYAASPRGGMVRVPPGVFTHGLSQNQARQALMAAGLNPDPQNLEQLAPPDDPPREVFVPGFDIDIAPVTNLAFKDFVDATNYPTPEGLRDACTMRPDHPVTHVTWRDALCYALWSGKRLPHPLEREKAARGDRDNRTYPWGDTFESRRCNHAAYPPNYFPTTCPVTAFTEGDSDGRSPFGVAGMAGNVSEWVSHGHASHGQGRDTEMRSVCGGAWNEPVAVYGAVSMQITADINYKSGSVGFRCAADIVYQERRITESPPQDNER
ncbi:bifunctional serine/threonine-protein kinase/formylglycine-generating enzyme family protein [Streptomyces sp. NPDC127098]|uniref:bifunctional serine/threonine-protein kinase/formylglycine-generating enzyme family protein n=1 Tax=Streptomyces sp. NPDC127098 TaxID=3347137 RepID=UPI0036656DAD